MSTPSSLFEDVKPRDDLNLKIQTLSMVRALDGVHRSILECGHSPRMPRQIEVFGHQCVFLVLL